MTALASVAALAGVLAFAFLFAGLGALLLSACSVAPRSRLEFVLFSLGAGVVVFEGLAFLGELSGNPRPGVLAAVVIAALLALAKAGKVYNVTAELARDAARLPGLQRWLAITIGVVFIFEGFAAVAPLTSSDALHYHFTAQALWLRAGFHASFFLSHSFFSGTNHQLILAGLALGSEKLALACIFLGGAAATLATLQLARQWTSGAWPLAAALAFSLTRVVLWQAAGSGSPDIWSAFFVAMAVLAILRAKESSLIAPAAIAGIFIGAVAGAKYTNVALAVLLGTMFVLEVRRIASVAVLLGSAAVAGAWPYLRNLAWTGDPFFPFLLKLLHPERVNAFTLASYRADTGAAAHHGLWQLLKFPVFSGMNPVHTGFWDLFGPLVLCLAPLTLCAIRNTPLWRIAIGVWIPGAIAIGAASGMTRFLLPLFPVALAASFAGAAFCRQAGWRAADLAARLSIAATVIAGFAGLCVYDLQPWRASSGAISRREYLREFSPDFGREQFVNEHVAATQDDGVVLVFFRYVYHLQVPFVYGNPDASWAIDPQRLQSDADWLQLFRQNHIRWIAHGPEYPSSIRDSLKRLGAEKILVPCASQSVEIWEGNQIGGKRGHETMTLECVRQ